MNSEEYVSRVREMVRQNRPLWYRMDRAQVASYRYLTKFADGEFENPGIHTLSAIEQYITAQAAA